MANPIARRKSTGPTEQPSDGGPQRHEYAYTVDGHVEFLNDRAGYRGHNRLWEAFTARNSQTGRDEVCCRLVSENHDRAIRDRAKAAPKAQPNRAPLDWMAP